METKNNIKFRLYQIDRTIDDEIVRNYENIGNDYDAVPKFYKLVWESIEKDSDLDNLHRKYTDSTRPNKHVCREIDNSDILEIENSTGDSKFYLSDEFERLFEIDFEKSEVPVAMGFTGFWYNNADLEAKRDINIEMHSRAVIEIIAQKFGKSRKEALKLFNRSETFKKLKDKSTKMYLESSYKLVAMIEEEMIKR